MSYARETTILLATALPWAAAARDGEGFADTRELLGEDVDADPDLGWKTGIFGFVRASYEHVREDPNHDFIGRNNGFIVQHARVGHEGWNKSAGLRYRISLEAATDLTNPINTPQATLGVRLRDAFIRYDLTPWLGVQLGQYKAHFAEEELRGAMDLLFASRAVGVDGVLVGRGFQTPGLQLDRQVGLMLSPAKPIGIVGDLAFSYYAMVANGNGDNQAMDDNGKPMLVGRLELRYGDWVLLGGAVAHNQRTDGTLPNLVEETDLSIAADLLITVARLEVFGQLIHRTTSYQTVGGTPDRESLAWHAQVGYRVDQLGVPIVPAYRLAYYDPWASGGSSDVGLDSMALMYHTAGVRVIYPDQSLGLSLYINYTWTQEDAPRELTNDRFEALAQLIF